MPDRLITLRELCEETGVSRRSVQRFEEAGLIKSTEKNNKGHLLYAQDSVERVIKIRFLQMLKLPLMEISTIICLSEPEFASYINKRTRELIEDSSNYIYFLEQSRVHTGILNTSKWSIEIKSLLDEITRKDT